MQSDVHSQTNTNVVPLGAQVVPDEADWDKRPFTGEELLRLSPRLFPVEGMLGGRMLTRGTVSFLAGDPGVGKTWLALKLADVIASGLQFAGMETAPGRVQFISQEMTLAEMRERWSEMHHIGDGKNIMFRFSEGINLGSWKGTNQVFDLVKRDSPAMTIIDNFRDVYYGQENNNDALSAVLKGLRDKVAIPLNTAILIVDHFGKPSEFRTGGAHSIRGGSVKYAIAATILTAERHEKDESRTRLVFAKSRRGRKPEPCDYQIYTRADGKVDVTFEREGEDL